MDISKTYKQLIVLWFLFPGLGIRKEKYQLEVYGGNESMLGVSLFSNEPMGSGAEKIFGIFRRSIKLMAHAKIT